MSISWIYAFFFNYNKYRLFVWKVSRPISFNFFKLACELITNAIFYNNFSLYYLLSRSSSISF